MVLSMPWDIINPRMNGNNNSWFVGRQSAESELHLAPSGTYHYYDVAMQIITWDRDDPFVIWC